MCLLVFKYWSPCFTASAEVWIALEHLSQGFVWWWLTDSQAQLIPCAFAQDKCIPLCHWNWLKLLNVPRWPNIPHTVIVELLSDGHVFITPKLLNNVAHAVTNVVHACSYHGHLLQCKCEVFHTWAIWSSWCWREMIMNIARSVSSIPTNYDHNKSFTDVLATILWPYQSTHWANH